MGFLDPKKADNVAEMVTAPEEMVIWNLDLVETGDVSADLNIKTQWPNGLFGATLPHP